MLSEHLKHRKLFVDKHQYKCYLDTESNIATFYLYNLSGQWIGYQTYNPGMPKYRTNLTPQEQRYYTHVTGKKAERMNAVWGLEAYDYRKKILFITEGIFDACVFHNLGYNAIAILANNPKKLKSWLNTTNHRVIGIADGDDAGMAIAQVANEVIQMPQGQDPNDLTEEELVSILKENRL